MPETLKMLVAVPADLEAELGREATELGLTRNQALLKIAHDHFGLEFTARGRGAVARTKEPVVYRFKTAADAVSKAIEIGKPIDAIIGKMRYRVFRSGMMKPCEEIP